MKKISIPKNELVANIPSESDTQMHLTLASGFVSSAKSIEVTENGQNKTSHVVKGTSVILKASTLYL
jgi:hypothetical protein